MNFHIQLQILLRQEMMSTVGCIYKVIARVFISMYLYKCVEDSIFTELKDVSDHLNIQHAQQMKSKDTQTEVTGTLINKI